MASKEPLAGVRVLEFAGLASAPQCGMILADFGADVIKIDRLRRLGLMSLMSRDRLTRGKRSLIVDLKQSEVLVVRKLSHSCDVLIDPFRPGVLEKFGLGPSELLNDNPRLIFARLSGFGQSGPWKHMAGHDINYLALSGLLSVFGRKDQNPLAPVNLVADLAGGSLTLVMGILVALFERFKSGKGQVIDASMVEGSAYVGTFIHMSQDVPILWGGKRGENILDSGSPIYDTYRTNDGQFLAVGALEEKFRRNLFSKLGLDENISMADIIAEPDRIRGQLAAIFQQKSREEWMEIFRGTDCCVTPVLNLNEVNANEQNRARHSFVPLGDDCPRYSAPLPAPRLDRTPACPKIGFYPRPGQHSVEILAEIGYSHLEIDHLLEISAVASDRVYSKL